MSLYLIAVYIPTNHLELVKQAMFDAGAGKIGDYDACSWQSAGTGQFRPLSGSQPFIGQTNLVETVEEYKVELVCDQGHIHDVLQAMLQAHPYETPAYHVLPVMDITDFS